MMADYQKRHTIQAFVILICVLAIPILSPVPFGVNGQQVLHDGKINGSHASEKVPISLYIGVVRNVHHNGGWEPSISAHAVCVFIISNQSPHLIVITNRNITLADCAWVGKVGPHTILGLYGA
jgi:hypothetical protein